MGNNKLNKKIIENVRNRVVVSNLESEESMKISKRKQILSGVAVMFVMLTGSFITVNAATNGELAQKVTDTIQVIFTDKDGNQEEIKGTTYTDSSNHTIEKYETNKNGSQLTLEIDKNNLDDSKMTIKSEMDETEDEISISINK